MFRSRLSAPTRGASVQRNVITNAAKVPPAWPGRCEIPAEYPKLGANGVSLRLNAVFGYRSYSRVTQIYLNVQYWASVSLCVLL